MKKAARAMALLMAGMAFMAFLPALFPARLIRKAFSRKVKSLWAGTPIITLPLKARAERLLGVDSRTLVYSTYFITDAFDYDLSRWRGLPVIGKLLPFGVFIYACIFYDRLHFFCDRGLLPSGRPYAFNFAELWAYRLLGMPVFLWTYGADVRSRGATLKLGEPNCCTECDSVGRACVCDDEARRANVERLVKYSKALFSMGDMTEYTPGSRNGLFFWPIDIGKDKYSPAYPKAEGRALTIVHAPNHRAFKGTHFLEKAVRELKVEGIEIELVIIEKIPNEKALELYRAADIVFDQCLIGFHGYFAIEAMAMGKPVMCFIRRPEYLLHPEECPIINTHINTLKEDLRRLALNREALTGSGMKGREYVERHFTIEAFSKRLGAAYREIGI